MKNFIKYFAISSIVTLGLCACSKVEDVSASSNAINVENIKKIEKGAEDIALSCRYVSVPSTDNYVLIYSTKYSVAKFGKEGEDGRWIPEYRLNSVSKTVNQVEINATSYNMMTVKSLDPSVKMMNENFLINRSSLYMRLLIEGGDLGTINMNYECSLLDDASFERHVNWVLENTKKIQAVNKI